MYKEAVDNVDEHGNTWFVNEQGQRIHGAADTFLPTLQASIATASTAATKSEKKYNQMDKAYEAGGAKKGFHQKHHEGIIDKAANAYSAVRHPVATFGDNIRSIPGRVADSVQDTLNIRGNDGKRYTERSNDARADRFNGNNQNGRTRNRDQI